MSSNDVQVEKKKEKKDFRGLLVFIIFFALGVTGGIVGTKYFFAKQAEEDKKGTPVINEVDITTKSEYQDLINELYDNLKGYNVFYSSKGTTIETMASSVKFQMIYDELIENQKYTTEKLVSTYVGSTVCANDFLVDQSATAGTISTTCTVNKILKTDIIDFYKKKFNREDIDTNAVYYPVTNKKCVSLDGYYYCGDATSLTGVTGNLDARFSIEKVIKDNDGNIFIYDKGYLIDTRSNVAVNNQINYYLHSTDSTEYYHELRSADNYIFKHTFKIGEDDKYYYTESVLEES